MMVTSFPSPDGEAADQLRLLMDGVRDYAVVILDRQGNVTGWSPAAERIKGWTEEEILGEHFSLFYAPEDVARGLPGHVLRTAETAGRYEEEGWRVRKDGTRFWASLVVTALVDDGGNLRGFGKLVRDITERREAELERNHLMAELERAARFDDLTGLLNRRTWWEELDLELARAGRYATDLAIAVLDLDHFKAVNDESGHLRGDAVLREVAAAWKTELRLNDSLARFGGDEFVCAFPSCSEGEAGTIVGRMLKAVPAGISASAGIAGWDHEESAEALFGRADRALYHAKADGRGRAFPASALDT